MKRLPLLTSKQAYLAMYRFLSDYNSRGPNEEIEILLGVMRLLNDGKPADGAYESDWEQAVKRVLEDDAA